MKRIVCLTSAVLLLFGPCLELGPTAARAATTGGETFDPATAQTLSGPVSTPIATGRTGALDGVACVTDSDCASVGYSLNSFDKSLTLAETWNGSTWAVAKTPDRASAIGNQLSAVACAGASDCTAVGDYFYDQDSLRNLVEHWNGSKWKIVPVPNPSGATSSGLNSVSCTSTSWCMAVGTYYLTDPVTGTPLLFAEEWNGATWSVLTSPDPVGSDGSYFDAIACESPSRCEAVGDYSPNNAGGLDTLAEAWNGAIWQLFATPDPANVFRSFLAGVSCASVSDCMAVGEYVNASNEGFTLAERWNGTRWALEKSSNPIGLDDSSLYGVACTQPTACTAVGRYLDLSDNFLTLAEKWNHSQWKVVPTANPTGGAGAALNDVACTSSSYCMAVGAGDGTLTELWNGSVWTLVPTRAPNLGLCTLSGVGVPCAA